MTAPAQRLPLIIAGLAAAICLGFAAFTGHMWEDYLITFRSSLNLATGHGLVFQPGERVHTFTSPLGTLFPALFALGGGDGVEIRALWLFRGLSAAFFGGAVFLVTRAQCRAGLMPLAVGAAALAWGFDAKSVDFSINGMESALLVFFVAWTWLALTRGVPLWSGAIALAGLQWTRPDGGIFFAMLALAWLVFGERSADHTSGKRLLAVARSALLGLALYLPWVLFAWLYYGSPVPHTILAKADPTRLPGVLGSLALYPWRLLFGHVALHDVFQPAYFFFGGWPVATAWISKAFTLCAALAGLWPRVRPAGRVASAAFFLGGFYVEYIPRSPWYYPGWEALAFIAWGYLLDAALRTGPARIGPSPASLTRITAAVFIAWQFSLLGAVAWQMRRQQAIIETGHRREIGFWLRANATPGDRVFLEPLGYIGFYSGLKMLDYPGLSAPEVVATRRDGHRLYSEIIQELRPEWLVLRPDQVDRLGNEAPGMLARDYRLARVFDVRSTVAASAFLPGRPYLEFDAVFLVFNRVHAAARAVLK